MIEKMNKRTKKAIVHTVESLIEKYGEAEVKAVVNRYFENIQLRKKLESEVNQKEKEFSDLKKKLSI